MKKSKISLVLLILVFTLMLSECKATTLTRNEYKFVTTYDQSWQYADGTQITNYVEYYEEYEVLGYEDNSILLELRGLTIDMIMFNYTLYETYFVAPIGLPFINASKFDYYYDVWLNTSDIYAVNFAAPVGTNHSKDERSAANYVFSGVFEGSFYPRTIGYEYNETSAEFEPINGEETTEAILTIEYDSDGVLIKTENEYTVTNDYFIEYEHYTMERVDEFPEPTKTSSYMLIAIFTMILVSYKPVLRNKKYRREK